MSQTSLPRTLLVAVTFTEHTPRLVHAASQLGTVLGMDLKFVNVVENIFAKMVGIDPYMIDAEMINKLDSDALIRAESRLKEVASLVPKNLKVDVKAVLSKGIPESILEEARESHATMILCGAGSGNYRYVPSGFSTALSLMANAEIPVMTLRQDVPFDFQREGLRILVADDLRDSGACAIHYALKLDSFSRSASIRHVYVGEVSARWYASMFEKILPENLRTSATVESKALSEALHTKFSHRLAERFERARAVSDGGAVKYAPIVLEGDVVEELGRQSAIFKPHMIVFGRHASVHQKPFAIGSVPFKVMLQQMFPIVVVP